MGKSNQRDLYFEKNIKIQPDATKYLLALRKSPYQTHQRMAAHLVPVFEELINRQKAEKESKEFADKILNGGLDVGDSK